MFKMLRICFIAGVLSQSFGFQMSPSQKLKLSQLKLSEGQNPGSSLPGFDEIVSPKTPRMADNRENPLVDRALDSALDFLQNGEAEGSEEDEEDEIDLYEIFEESPDIEIPYDLIAELELMEAKAESSKVPNQESINKANILAAVAKWKLHPNDVGSAEVQIVAANEKIKYLTKHLLANKKDKAAMRGLDALVNLRRKFLNFLYTTNQSKAEAMVAELGIRFRPPGQVWDKDSKYRAFKNTKSKWQKIRAEKKALRKTSA